MNIKWGEFISMKNIMFVAPSKIIADMAAQVTSEMGVEIPIVVSTRAETEDVVKNNPNIEIFISRGRIAKSLQQFSGKSVVYIMSSITDILESVQNLTSCGIDKIGVMASPLLIGEGTYNYKIANTEIYIHPYESDELDKTALQMQKQGVKGVIIGAVDSKAVEKYNMKAEELNTSTISVKRAIAEAIKIAKAQESERLRETKKSEEIKQHAVKLYDVIEQSASAVEQLASSSEELAATSQETANAATEAFEEVKSTSEILEIIQRVAKQTNLLGLNAAIEASRAGEYGRGFSVVAAEVRKLAKESNTSAIKINSILNQFRSSVELVLQNIDQSNAITQEQAKANQNIAHMLDNLREVGRKLIDMAERK